MLAPLVRPAELEFPPPLDALPEAIRKDFEALSEHPASAWLRGIYARHRGRPTPALASGG
jgi:hypothetical protein